MARDTSIGDVADQGLLGVRIEQHVLDRRVRQLVMVAKKMAESALEDLRNMRDPLTEFECMQYEAVAKRVTAIVKKAELSDKIIRGLLAEMRERAKLAASKPELTDERFEENFRALVRELTDDDIQRIRMEAAQ